MTVAKETKAQRVERLKREKNAWEHLDEIREFARQGRDSIPPEWTTTYFRTWGVYTQGDGAGVVGGANGEGKATAYFMVRIRIPNGILTSEQTRLIAALSEEYGRSYADITVRQNIQLHWISIEALPDLLERLWAAGLTTTGACGDVVRTVTGCPVAGLDAHELVDASALAVAVDRALGGNTAFYNLPRKFKISVTGCRDWCSYPEINDIGFTATTRIRDGKTEIGFSLRVGGGLSKEPHIAVRLNVFVKWDQVVPVAAGITEVFRDSDMLRQSRDKARMKYLFLQHGWTADSFLAALQARLSFKLDPAEPEELPEDIHRDHTGIHVQKQTGLSFVGASVLRGRIAPPQLRKAAELADRFAKGRIRLTIMQNILIADVASEHAEAVAGELVAAGLPVRASVFQRGTIACTGSEFCKLALTETKGFARWLTEELDERLPGFHEQIKLHVTGCPNSCGQHWIADIGIEGKKIKTDGKMVDAYYFCVGGSVGHFASIARPVGFRCAATEVPGAIARVLGGFQKNRSSNESLREFFARHNNDEIRALLAGDSVQAMARDLPEGRVPHGVDG
ncbi:MAG: sulfite reductase SirA [Candidatus Acidiferrum sp.]